MNVAHSPLTSTEAKNLAVRSIAMKPSSLAKKWQVYAPKIFPLLSSKPAKTFNLFTPQLLSSNSSMNSSYFRFFSSENGSSNHPSPECNDSANRHDRREEGLKELVNRFYEGDNEAIPSIFEAILKRKLDGTGEESDEEFLNELQKNPKRNDVSDEESGPATKENE